MSGLLYLSSSFASQSLSPARLTVTQRQEEAGAVALLIEADAYPRAGRVRIAALRPGLTYAVSGAAARFCRSDAAGTAQLALTLAGPTLILLNQVV